MSSPAADRLGPAAPRPSRPPAYVRVLAWVLRPVVAAVAQALERAAEAHVTPHRTRPRAEHPVGVSGLPRHEPGDATGWSRRRRYWELEAKVRLGEPLTATERQTYAELLRWVVGGVE